MTGMETLAALGKLAAKEAAKFALSAATNEVGRMIASEALDPQTRQVLSILRSAVNLTNPSGPGVAERVESPETLSNPPALDIGVGDSVGRFANPPALGVSGGELVTTFARSILGSETSNVAIGGSRDGVGLGTLGNSLDGSRMREVQRWVEGADTVGDRARINFGDLKERSDQLDLRAFAQHLVERQPSFGAQCERLSAKLREAQTLGPGEVQRVERQIRSNGKGALAEHVVSATFQPYFGSVQTQVTAIVGERGTRIDLLLLDAKVPMISRGFYVPQGGALGLEGKAGTVSYLRAQEGHIAFQTQGHEIADASLTVTSRDLHDLTRAEETAMRARLRENTGLLALLPRAEELDRVMLDLISSMASRTASNS